MDWQQITDIPRPPARPDDAHKGTFGTVIVVGGLETMIGAPAFCAAAAFRAGTGLVRIASWPGVLPLILTVAPQATGLMLEANPARSISRINDVDPNENAVLAVGPGMGRSDAALRLVDQLLREPRTVVLDADGLAALVASGRLSRSSTSSLVLTPHPGEFDRLAQPVGIRLSPTDPEQRPQAAWELAQANNAVVVLKGKNTVVTDGQSLYINQTGNPALAAGGSGDVLTGVIASLIAQGMSTMDACVLGVYLHGLAADLWTRQHANVGLHPMELAEQIPHAIKTMATLK